MSKSPAASFFSVLTSNKAEAAATSDALAKQKEEMAQLRDQVTKLAAENETFRFTITLKDEEFSKQKEVSSKLLEDVDRLSRDLMKIKEERAETKFEDSPRDFSLAREAYDVSEKLVSPPQSHKLPTASPATSHKQPLVEKLQTSTPTGSRKHIMVENVGSPSTSRKLLDEPHAQYDDHRLTPATSHKIGSPTATSPSVTPRDPRRDATPSIRTDVAETATDASSVSSDRKRRNLSPMRPLEEDLEARNSQLEDEKGRLRVRLELVESENRALKSRVERLESNQTLAGAGASLDPEKATSYQDIIRQLHDTISLKDTLIEKSHADVKIAESRWKLAQTDLLNKLQKTEKEKESLQADLEKFIKKGPTLAASGRHESLQLERLNGERDSLKIQLAQLQSEVERLKRDVAQNAAAVTERDSLKALVDKLQSQVATIQAERDLFKSERESLKAEREVLKASLSSYQADAEKLRRDPFLAKSLRHDDDEKTPSAPGSLASSFIGAAVAATRSAFKPSSPPPTTPDQSRSKPSSSASLSPPPPTRAGPTSPPPPTSPNQHPAPTPALSSPTSGPKSFPPSTSFSASVYSPRKSGQEPEQSPIPSRVLAGSFSKPQSPGVPPSPTSARDARSQQTGPVPASSSFSSHKGSEAPSSSRAKDAPAGTAQSQTKAAVARTRSGSAGEAASDARSAIAGPSRGLKSPVQVRGVQLDPAKSPPPRNLSGGKLRVTPVGDTDELQLSKDKERRNSWTPETETSHDDSADAALREYASSAATPTVTSSSLLFGIQHRVMNFFSKVTSPSPSPLPPDSGPSSPTHHHQAQSSKLSIIPDIKPPPSTPPSRKVSASSEPGRSADEPRDHPVSPKVEAPPDRVKRPVFTLNFKRTNSKERVPAAQVPNDVSKALSKLVAASSKEVKAIPKEELSRLGVFALAGLVSDKKLTVNVLENPNEDDEKAYMHVGSGETCTVISPSKLSGSDRVTKRILRAVQRSWTMCRPAGTNKVYEFPGLPDLFLDAVLDRGRYCFAQHVDKGTIPYTVYVYAAGVSKAEFDLKVAKLDFEARERWAFRTPSKKPLLLLLFDMESRAGGGKKGPADIITAELADAAKEKIRSFRGFHPCWRHYLDGIDCDQDPLAKLLWTRKGEFVEDVMFEKEKNRGARVPLKATNANDMIRQLGFVEGKTLGRGGFSSVVSCTKDGKPYAVKIQRFKEWRDPSSVDRSALEEFELDPAIIEECKVNRLLNTLDWLKKCTPNFIPMRDWFYSPKDGSHIQVIDRCDMTLTQFLECFDEQHPAGFLIALRGILAQVCIAMHHASLAFGFKHADFKAHNILLQFHPDPRKLFPELAEIPPTQPFNRRWLRYSFLDDRGQPQNFIFDMTVVPFAKIADFGRSRMYAMEMDDSGGFSEAEAPPLHAMTKVYEAQDLRFLVIDLLWRSDRLRVRSLQQLFGNAKAREIFEALLGKSLDEVRKRAGACVRAEDATVRDVFGNLPEVTPMDALRSPCFSHDRKFAMEGIEHTYSNTSTFLCCPEDVVLRGLYGGKRL